MQLAREPTARGRGDKFIFQDPRRHTCSPTDYDDRKTGDVHEQLILKFGAQTFINDRERLSRSRKRNANKQTRMTSVLNVW